MFGARVPPVRPIPSEGDGSWVWALVAIAVVLGALAATWWARLWAGLVMPRETIQHAEPAGTFDAAAASDRWVPA
jgi:hypothetical protein